MTTSKCNHTVLDTDCPSCLALQKQWYSKLKEQGFRDLEGPSGRAGIMLDSTLSISDVNSEFYSAVWSVYHKWTAEGRPERDMVVCELYATQDKLTGTTRGISKELKRRNIRPSRRENVEKTIAEIKAKVIELLKASKNK